MKGKAACGYRRRVRLGELLRLRKDIVHPHDKPQGKAIFVGLEHLESGTGRRTGLLEVDLRRLTGRKPKFYKGDIVYGYLRPYLNKVWVAEFDGLCSVDQYVYEVDYSVADADFVAWFIRSPHYLTRAPVTAGPGQLPRIRLDEVAAVEVDLPDLGEQQRMVAVLRKQLSAVERAHAAVATQLETAKNLPAAFLHAVFFGPEAQDWPRRQLGEVVEIVSGITLGRPLTGARVRQVPYLRVANVKDGYLDLSNVYQIGASADEIERLRLRPGDVLLTEGGDADKLGRGTVWRDELPECVHQNHIFRVRLDLTRFVPDFVAAQIGSRYGKSYFAMHAKQTTGIATINRKVLAGFPVMAPERDKQERVAARLAARMAETDRVRRSLQVRLADISALRTTFLRRAFNN